MPGAILHVAGVLFQEGNCSGFRRWHPGQWFIFTTKDTKHAKGFEGHKCYDPFNVHSATSRFGLPCTYPLPPTFVPFVSFVVEKWLA
jgi:hypothetical protein